MKLKIILSVILALCFITGKAQIYDGITQPTRFRIFVPSTVSLHNSKNITVAPFIGFKQDLGARWSVTPVVQYNINNEALIPQIWINYNIDKKFYLLSRSLYNFRSKRFSETLSFTYKLPYNMMIDGTWENLVNGKDFCKGDRLQFDAGWAYKFLVFNVGYSCRTSQGFICNLRFKITDYNWLQLKYDYGLKSIQVSTALQFN